MQQAAAELDYRLDHTARFLRRRRSDLIGFVMSSIENTFFTEVAHAAEQAARERGYSLIICNTDEDPAREQQYVELLDRLLAAGVILAPAPGEAPYLRRFIGGRMPIVLFNRSLNLPLPAIVGDDEEAAYACTKFLLREGHKRIAAVTGLAHTSTTEQRLAGYRRAMSEAGLRLDQALEVSGRATLQGGYIAGQHLLRSEHPPTAILAFNNLITRGIVIALLDAGLRWPDDVDVAGFGFYGEARLYRPPLTLVAQPTYEMGIRAVQMILDRTLNASANASQRIVLRNRLITRDEWSSPALPGAGEPEYLPEEVIHVPRVEGSEGSLRSAQAVQVSACG